MNVKATVTLKGMKFYVCSGVKHSGDERLYLTTIKDGRVGRRVPLETAHLAFMVDHYYKNEELIYPRAEGFMGGEMLINCLRRAGEGDWRTALRDYNVCVPQKVIYS